MLHIGEVDFAGHRPAHSLQHICGAMNEPHWVKKFRKAERPGLYCRVLQEGMINTGDTVSREPYQGETLSLLEMYREYYVKNKSRETLLRHLRAPIAIRARQDLEEELQKIDQ